MSSNASLMTSFTSSKHRWDVIWRVPLITSLPSASMMRRYPHQLLASPAPQYLMARLRRESLRSHVLNAQGTKSSSAKIFPASLHPCHPDHSTKLANIGLPVTLAWVIAGSNSPCLQSAVKLTYSIVPNSTYSFGGGCHCRFVLLLALSATASPDTFFFLPNIPMFVDYETFACLCTFAIQSHGGMFPLMLRQKAESRKRIFTTRDSTTAVYEEWVL